MKTYTWTNVHNIFIHNSSEPETTQMFINRWMDKQIVYPCNEYLSAKKETNYLYMQQMDVPQKVSESINTKWKKADAKDYILYNSTYMQV